MSTAGKKEEQRKGLELEKSREEERREAGKKEEKTKGVEMERERYAAVKSKRRRRREGRYILLAERIRNAFDTCSTVIIFPYCSKHRTIKSNIRNATCCSSGNPAFTVHKEM
jgi:hypothetical protein